VRHKKTKLKKKLEAFDQQQNLLNYRSCSFLGRNFFLFLLFLTLVILTAPLLLTVNICLLTADFAGDFAGDFASDFTGDCTGDFTGDFIGNLTNFVGISCKKLFM